MKECRQTPSNGALFHIYLKKQGGEAWSGSVTGKGIPEPVSFSSLSRMVLVLEELMDLYETLPDTQPGCRAETPDVELEILFRQNYSWQGRFRRPGDPGVTTFHSVLELLILLETALEQ